MFHFVSSNLLSTSTCKGIANIGTVAVINIEKVERDEMHQRTTKQVRETCAMWIKREAGTDVGGVECTYFDLNIHIHMHQFLTTGIYK